MTGPLPSADELAEIQSQEVEALTAILGDDFKVVPVTSAWKNVQGAHDLAVSLRVEDDDNDNARSKPPLTLRFHLPKTYPYAPPSISIEKDKACDVSASAVSALGQVLRREAQAHIGTEMLWDLVSLAQEYLANHHHDRQEKQAEPNISLEEEQRLRIQEAKQAELERKAAEQAAAAQAEAARAEQLSRDIELTTAKHAEALRKEKRRVRLENHPTIVQDIAATPRTPSALDDGRVITFLDPIEDGGRAWSAVRVGPVIDRSALFTTSIAEPVQQDPSSSSSNGNSHVPSWIVEQFDIKTEYFHSSSGRKKLEEIEAEIEKLRRAHDLNLVNVKASSLMRIVSGTAQSWRLNVVLERNLGPTVAEVLEQAECLPWPRVQTYLLGLLAGLDALHLKGLVHRKIGPESIQICPGAQGPRIAKLRDCSYVRRLQDLHRSHPLIQDEELKEEVIPRSWQAPEAVDAPKIYTKKRDVWDLARCTVQMLCGLDALLVFSCPEKLLENNSDILHPMARELLAYMLDRSPRRRPSAESVTTRLNELIAREKELDTVDGSSGNQRFSKLAVPQPLQRNRSSSDARQVTHIQAPIPLARPGSFWQLGQTAQQEPTNYSRYRADFEEVKFLGKGAFGSVVKARNRLDGNFYAIKRIKLSSSPQNDERTLREITALSRLSHAHIVRYVTCWIEAEVVQTPSTEATFSEVTNSQPTQQSKSLHDGNSDLNFGFNDDDFMSRGHDAFSASYPDIQFRRDSESEDDSTSDSEDDSDSDSESDSGSSTASEQTDARGGGAHLRSVSAAESQLPASAAPTRWLHIQMELVDSGTLKDAIDQGLSVENSWRYFRQLLEALAHINSLGIVHRDIKPANIMVTPSGDVKLGDFGLATTNHQQFDQNEAGTADMMDSTDMTSDIVGTNLYIAPEILRGTGKRRGDKVDMYSLGIVFFEMLASQRVYTTGMERVAVLKELRLEHIKFPGAWPSEEFAVQTTILRSLLNHNEDQRPTPVGLLKSELLPPKLEDDYIEECLRLMSNPTSAYHHRLLDALFTEVSNDEVREFTFDVGAEGEAHQPYLNVIVERLQMLFKRHGAVPLRTPLLMPPNDMYGTERKPVQLLDKTGKLVQLPYDHLVAFARVCARSLNQRFKRYEIGHVFRENVIAGSQPRSLLEIDFDIISPEKTRLAEAEVLLLLEEIIDDVPGLSTEDWVIHLNHGEVLDILLDRVPDKHRPALLAAVAGLGSKRTNASARSKLAQLPLARSVLDEIEAASMPGELKTVQQRLERLIAVDHRPKLALAFQQLEEVIRLARQFGVQRPLLMAPMMVQGSSFYRGEAIGGRYDWLIRHFANPAAGSVPPHGVGMQISAGQIAASLSRYQDRNVSKFVARAVEEERSFGQWTPRRADVYVASGEQMADARIEVVRMLWAHGINADLAYDHVSSESAEAIASTCRSEGILFLVYMPHPNKLKVKNILRRTEQEVARHELCSWLATEIARQRAVDVIHGGHSHSGSTLPTLAGSGAADLSVTSFAGPGIPTSNPTAPNATPAPSMGGVSAHITPGAGQGFDFTIVLPDREKRGGQNRDNKDRERRLKGSSKQAVQDKAAREAARIGEELLYGNAAVFVVDVSWPTLQRLGSACLQSEDRTFTEMMAGVPEDKDYLRKIRRAVGEMAAAPGRTGQVRLLFSSRVDRGVILT
ncbi:eukaryotic translation initiation factor 2-alpha kinase [Tilletia horrida]|nr:eukaryotic translation initiation factor 2-alpha kinase [Tilletia horrida]